MPALRVIEPGEMFGRLMAYAPSIGAGEQKRVLCLCLCGTVREFRAKKIVSGETVSCGCYGKERVVEANSKHGAYRSPEHRSWRNMWTRVQYTKDVNYKNYGGRGIKVCDRWRDFKNFLADMGSRPPKHSLDRIDVNGNYEPGNCRWADSKTQAANKRKRSS